MSPFVGESQVPLKLGYSDYSSSYHNGFQCNGTYMSYSLNSLKQVISGIILRIVLGVIKGDTRSPDWSSNDGLDEAPFRTVTVRGA